MTENAFQNEEDADDASGKEYNVEVQRSDKGADKKRARYHSSILDAHLLKPGDKFVDLPDSDIYRLLHHTEGVL